MPRIRSQRTAFDPKFPKLAAGGQSVAGPPVGGARPLTSESTAEPAIRRTAPTPADDPFFGGQYAFHELYSPDTTRACRGTDPRVCPSANRDARSHSGTSRTSAKVGNG